jgi:hypothetical protein
MLLPLARAVVQVTPANMSAGDANQALYNLLAP